MHDNTTIAGLDARSTLEFLTDASQTLWGGSSYEDLVSRFVQTCQRHFGLTAASLYRIVPRSAQVTIQPAIMHFNEIPALDEFVKEEMEPRLRRAHLDTTEMRTGIVSYHVDGQDLSFLLLGDPNTDGQILVWKGHTPGCEPLQEFLARQLQSSCSWIARLDRTQELVHRDDLTGLFNVRYLEVALESEVRRAQRFDANFSLLFIDLDNFKLINDKFGHLEGSSILKQVARTLLDAAREVDSVIRFGGDEFVILLLGSSSATGLLAAERIRQTIEDERFMLEDGNHVSLTASIGVASYPEHATDKIGLLKISDETMYAGKKNGKNRVVLFSNDSKTSLKKGPRENEQ